MVVQYKCPNCGADMAFDSASGMLHCDSCSYNEPIDVMAQQFDTQSSTTHHTDNDLDDHQLTQYQCKNCGAVLLTDRDTVATTCSFCGAGVVLSDRLSGGQGPTKVIPFSLGKQQAQEAFEVWCKKGRLTPKKFSSSNRIKSLTGIYVPFWLYDLNGLGDALAECTKVRFYSDSDYRYTETKYFHVHRQVDLNYSQIPVDASEKMDDQLMEKLEPYDYQNLKQFKIPYLTGFLAEKYNYDYQQLFQRVQSRAEDYVTNYINSTIFGYDSVTFLSKRIDIKNNNAEYALLPVWMFRCDYNRKEYSFAMNGQTGKIAGKLPLSRSKIAAWFFGISAAVFALLNVIAAFMGGSL
ncbi:MAG: hypothetical protein VB071_06915 [Lawsonibacter sp.]|nr:hypothetical protein [Lawsonibacter sp.]